MIPGFGNVTALFARDPRWLSAGMSLLLHVSLFLALVLITTRTPQGGDFPPPPIAVTLVRIAAMPTQTPSASALASLAPSAAQPELQRPELRQSQTQLFSAIPNLVQTIVPAPAPLASAQPVPQHKPAPPKATPTPPAPVQTAQATPRQPTPQPPVHQPTPQPPMQMAASATAGASAIDQGTGRGGHMHEDSAAIGSGSRQSPGDEYLEQVRRWVEHYKKYPDSAFKNKQEGAVAVAFKFGRDGTILDAWIDKSSGYPLLDQAALDMIHAASPISKMPDHYPGETLTLVMTENFTLGLFDRLFH